VNRVLREARRLGMNNRLRVRPMARLQTSARTNRVPPAMRVQVTRPHCQLGGTCERRDRCSNQASHPSAAQPENLSDT
jgi:hypothetical protein